MSQTNLNTLAELLEKIGRLDGHIFSALQLSRLLRYYEFVLKWNARLHLTTLIEPSLFFQRHLQESELAESLLLPSIGRIWDLGSGLGIPGLPMAILRDDLQVCLVEAKRQKVIFLEEVVSILKLENVEVINCRIEVLQDFSVDDCLVTRAMENLENLIPLISQMGENCSQMLFLGSDKLEKIISSSLPKGFYLARHRIQDADRRVVFNLKRST